ncbi:MAG: penicillin-binding protein 2 [Gammaproteobacteria bacterium]|nr:penicillin-binding protein 2 [Gammaproteobacteria bacterium]
MHKNNSPYRWRLWFLCALLAFAFLCIAWRVVTLTLFEHTFLQKQGDARSSRFVAIPAHRGMILDRNNEPLAISTPVSSVWINPKEFNTHDPKFAQLIPILSLDRTTLFPKLADKHREFLYLKRQISPAMANEAKALHLPGLHFQEEFRRYYPESEALAQLLGTTNIDDQGQEGLELAYNSWLEGTTGLKHVTKDRLGQIIDEYETVREPKPGQSIQLSIDRRIQYVAYHALQQGVEKFHAEAGSVVILDPQNGEVLAMTNYPSFNPNVRAPSDAEHRNRAITDVFEPGSTIKAFTVVNALNSGKYHANSQIETSPGWMIVAGKQVKDVHNKGLLNLTDILKYSSNVGITKIALSLPPNSLWNLLHNLGFGQLTDLQLPGERTGSLENHFIWHPFTLATLSFGYGMDSTALQLAQAYNVIASGGVKRPLSLFRTDTPPPGKRIIDPRSAQALITMMEAVVDKTGTAPLAKVPGYTTSGKTSTARCVGKAGYLKHNYNSSFVGIIPAEQPRLLIAVVLYNLSGTPYYGGYTAGPIFADIAGQTLHLLAVPPTQEMT